MRSTTGPSAESPAPGEGDSARAWERPTATLQARTVATSATIQRQVLGVVHVHAIDPFPVGSKSMSPLGSRRPAGCSPARRLTRTLFKLHTTDKGVSSRSEEHAEAAGAGMANPAHRRTPRARSSTFVQQSTRSPGQRATQLMAARRPASRQPTSCSSASREPAACADLAPTATSSRYRVRLRRAARPCRFRAPRVWEARGKEDGATETHSCGARPTSASEASALSVFADEEASTRDARGPRANGCWVEDDEALDTVGGSTISSSM